jgi:hypothetical protein
MGRVLKYLRLRAAERHLLLKVTLLLWVIRLALWLLPFRIVRHMVSRFSDLRVADACSQQNAEAILWAVRLGSRYVPAATCLTQALVGKLLLARRGLDATLRVGVAFSDSGSLQAHAWVESNGRIVLGGSEVSVQCYTPLASFDKEV